MSTYGIPETLLPPTFKREKPTLIKESLRVMPQSAQRELKGKRLLVFTEYILRTSQLVRSSEKGHETNKISQKTNYRCHCTNCKPIIKKKKKKNSTSNIKQTAQAVN